MCHLIYSFLATFLEVAFFAAVLGPAFLVVDFFSADFGADFFVISVALTFFGEVFISAVFFSISFLAVLAAFFFKSIECILTAVKSCL
jgi:uncharacterized membrane protein